jgi:hypothetical protein
MPQNTAIWAAPPRMPNRAKNAPSPLGRGCPGRAALTRAPTPRETDGQAGADPGARASASQPTLLRASTRVSQPKGTRIERVPAPAASAGASLGRGAEAGTGLWTVAAWLVTCLGAR